MSNFQLTVSAVKAEQCSLQEFASNIKAGLPVEEEAKVDPHLSVLLELAHHCLMNLLRLLLATSKVHDTNSQYYMEWSSMT